VADPGRVQSHAHLARSRRRQLERLDGRLATDLVEDGGADPQGASAPRLTRAPGGVFWSSRSASTVW
jgi:hypothetical protein